MTSVDAGILAPYTVTRGDAVVIDAAVAVVVMAIDADPRALFAAASIVDQETAAEIVIVNTGRGSIEPLMSAFLRSRITLVESSKRLFAGAARNLGIAHTQASIIAFLAADCRATKGWLGARVSAHHDGNCMVASALRPLADERGHISSTAWAAHLLTHFARAPGTSAAEAARYGVSYDRKLFHRFSFFNPGVRVSEDLEFNRACREARLEPAWMPEILTLHDYPRRVLPAMIDQFWRGVLSTRYALENDNVSANKHARRIFCRTRDILRAIRTERADFDFRHPMRVRVLTAVLGMVLMTGTVAGVAFARRRKRQANGSLAASPKI